MPEKIDPTILVIGQTFLDVDGALCVYLGYAMEAIVYTRKGSVQIGNTTHSVIDYVYDRKCVYQMFYKNTWIQVEKDHVKDIEAFALNDKAKDLMGQMAGHYVHKNSWCCND